MKVRLHFVFVLFFFTAVLIFTVYLRTTNSQIFYRVCVNDRQQEKLKQQLWQKQLQLESLINPAAVAERLTEK